MTGLIQNEHEKTRKQQVKLVRQLHLISHFWEAFEAGDERVMETLVLTDLRYRGRELTWSCMMNRAFGTSWNCLIQMVLNTKSSPLGGRGTQPGMPSTVQMHQCQLTQGLEPQML